MEEKVQPHLALHFFHANVITKQSVALGIDITVWKETIRAKKFRNIVNHH